MAGYTRSINYVIVLYFTGKVGQLLLLYNDTHPVRSPNNIYRVNITIRTPSVTLDIGWCVSVNMYAGLYWQTLVCNGNKRNDVAEFAGGGTYQQ